MYSETTGSRKTLGDVDVPYHDGIYHLFHLVLPSHDFIAHAVSDNCLTWRRVENALFLGDPGSWDDSMLWTMHVSANPHKPGSWRMFYTGLSRRDHGRKQRIGMAESDACSPGINHQWHGKTADSRCHTIYRVARSNRRLTTTPAVVSRLIQTGVFTNRKWTKEGTGFRGVIRFTTAKVIADGC
jgi:hypothetical protein